MPNQAEVSIGNKKNTAKNTAVDIYEHGGILGDTKATAITSNNRGTKVTDRMEKNASKTS